MTPAKAQAPGAATNEGAYSQSDAYVVAYAAPPTRKYFPASWTFCSCVNYVKALLGVTDQSWGWAGKIPVTHSWPAIGDVVLTTEGGGHAAVVTDIRGGMLYLKEANYVHCQVSTRTLAMDDPRIRGYTNASEMSVVLASTTGQAH